MDFAVPQIVRHKLTGDLLVTRRRYEPGKNHLAGYDCSPIDYANSYRGYPDDDLEPAPPRKRGDWYDLKTEIEPRAQGALPWEHIEPAPLALTLSNVACCAGWVAYPGIAWVQKPGSQYKDWARLFLHTQNGGFGALTGEAHALVYEQGPRRPPWPIVERLIKAASAAVHKRRPPAGDLASAALHIEGLRAFEQDPPMPSAWRLSICKHHVIDTSTPEGRMRGWRPAHCAKCGLNLSVDSSD